MSVPPRVKSAWLVVFTEPGYPTIPELEVYQARSAARSALKAGLDPGWRGDLYRVYLDEWHQSKSAPPAPDEEEQVSASEAGL